ncbi:tyrosine-type recombinase/integrase [Rivularia sp. UHCC 0363]|uniref:tyrosine-type recombinase/integrase n=1 Tax=Rivularia sp. UHCC 0363 TaxID=3110244 RepID=UPI002B210D69|nr:tyrosine-type recombinase/integrase [Rivularia sp. UHCC 0363]MEA5599269.1 tyrosine-type recombinase/integrase [Rivularia sp. UHCC 0363]
MSDTPDDAVTSLEKSLATPIERYFAADDSEQDIIASMLSSIRTESTKREYRKDLNKFFKEMTETEPNSDSVLEFLHLSEKRAVAVVLKYKGKLLERGLKEATVNRRITSIKSLVKFARKLGVCTYSLEDVEMEKAVAYRDTTGVDAKTYAAVVKMCDRATKIGKRDYAILRLLWENGLRRGEISKLSVKDFDPHVSRLRIFGKGKGNNDEWLKVSPQTVSAITEWLDARSRLIANDALFISLDNNTWGYRLSGNAIRQIVVRRFKAAGIDKVMSPHRVRHSGVTTVLEINNGNITKGKTYSRHSKVETVMVYDDNRNQNQSEITNQLADLID